METINGDQHFCLRWNNHQNTLISVFHNLLNSSTLVDCALSAEGKTIQAHKVLLSACSPYFATLLSQHYDKHPIIILKDVRYTELKSMMEYMYRGEVNISQDELSAFLKAAESLQIKGLSDNGDVNKRINDVAIGGTGNFVPSDKHVVLDEDIHNLSHNALKTIEEKHQQQQQHPNKKVTPPPQEVQHTSPPKPQPLICSPELVPNITSPTIHNVKKNERIHGGKRRKLNTPIKNYDNINQSIVSPIAMLETSMEEVPPMKTQFNINRSLFGSEESKMKHIDELVKSLARPKNLVEDKKNNVGVVLDEEKDTSHQTIDNNEDNCVTDLSMSEKSEDLSNKKIESVEKQHTDVIDIDVKNEVATVDSTIDNIAPVVGCGDNQSEKGGGDLAEDDDVVEETKHDETNDTNEDNRNIFNRKNDVPLFPTFGMGLPGMPPLPTGFPNMNMSMDMDKISEFQEKMRQIMKLNFPQFPPPIPTPNFPIPSPSTIPDLSKPLDFSKFDPNNPATLLALAKLQNFGAANNSFGSPTFGPPNSSTPFSGSPNPFLNHNGGTSASAVAAFNALAKASMNKSNPSTLPSGGIPNTNSNNVSPKLLVPHMEMSMNSSQDGNNTEDDYNEDGYNTGEDGEDRRSATGGDKSNGGHHRGPDGNGSIANSVHSDDGYEKYREMLSNSDLSSLQDNPAALSTLARLHWLNWDPNPKYVRTTQENQYSCQHCGKRYRWKSTLKRHEVFECGGKEPVHQCPHCDYRAKQSGNLRVHIRKYHTSIELQSPSPAPRKPIVNPMQQQQPSNLSTNALATAER